MCPLGSQLDAIDMIPCPKEGQGLVGVTAPEALEIADYVQRNLPLSERNRIHDLARANADKLATMTRENYDASQTPCPLQGSDGVCLAYLSRPLHCRPLHAATIWRERGLKRSIDAERDFDEQIVKQGAEAGLTEALVAAGRDGNVYELNSALLAALDIPDAAVRWAKGEDVFKQCKRFV
jgi:Fe-S-cluster containining protein